MRNRFGREEQNALPQATSTTLQPEPVVYLDEDESKLEQFFFNFYKENFETMHSSRIKSSVCCLSSAFYGYFMGISSVMNAAIVTAFLCCGLEGAVSVITRSSLTDTSEPSLTQNNELSFVRNFYLEYFESHPNIDKEDIFNSIRRVQINNPEGLRELMTRSFNDASRSTSFINNEPSRTIATAHILPVAQVDNTINRS